MKKHLLLLIITAILFSISYADAQSRRLKIFIDCSNTWCDMNFIKTEVTLVDFLLDRQAADVHVLITEQNTGGGGDQYQLIFFGQNQYRQMADTIRFNTGPNATDFEERDMLVKHLQLGLTPYLVRAGYGNDITINMKKAASDKSSNGKPDTTATKDPWNYWVFRVGMNGHLSADEVYKESRLSGNFSVNRVTEELKTGFEVYGGKNKTTYDLEDANGNPEKLTIKNDDYSFQHFLVKSLTDHWSWGYEAVYSRSTFSNNKSRALFRTGIEFDIFPYKEVNTKFFTFSYLVDVRRNKYFDTTLYDKTQETLWGHGLESNLSLRQKWGTLSFGAEYHNYLHDWKFFNLGVNFDVELRITGGLFFNVYTSAQLVRDQVYLPKGGATQEEVLTRRRQLASGYYLFTYFGINYRFGSKLNNFVNPRFD